FDNGELHIRDEMLAGFPRTPEETRRHIAEYYAMISHLDAQIGRILTALDENDLTDDTIVVLAGDNGLAVGRHGLFGKQNLYDHSVRVPLIFAGPNVPQNQRCQSFAYLLDVFPTLCDLTGIDIPESVEGRSLRSALQDPKKQVREKLFFAYTDCQRGLRDQRYKLIQYVVDGRHNMTQLFDLREDPWELNNLATNANYAEKRDELRGMLSEYSKRWDDADSSWGKAFWDGFTA
ncbi:MAG: sulfatase-like hydrolase/transferase, partial [Planctomycetes bacterium]|nr:sulfatase-like hydrolase/transferase [Planctomycetota bacterium]